MRRGCLIAPLAVLALCLAGGALAWFVALPAVRRDVRGEIEDGVAAEVARRIPPTPGLGVAPGTYVVTEDQLQAGLRANAEDDGLANLVVRLSPTGVALGFATRGQSATYTGRPAAANGRLVLRDMATTNDALAVLLPPDDLGRAIADAVNGYLAANDLRLQSVALGDGTLTLTTAPAP